MDTVKPQSTDHVELAASLAGQGVEFAVGSFIDVMGRAKSKVVPISHLPNLLAGSERYTPRGMGDLGQMTPNEDECVAMPDAATLRICPWDRRFAWFAADLLYGGQVPFDHCTRSILKRQVASAADQGLALNLGVEVEFFVFKPESLERGDGYLVPMARSGQLDPTPAYDVEVAMDAMPFLEPMAKFLDEAGFGLFSFDTEGGDAQYEFDFTYAPVLEMADRVAFFRLMAKQVAKQVGLMATFMPKPYTESWGSGAHFNMSLENAATGANLFRDPDDARGKGWSKQAYSFLAGIIRHARSIAAVATPTVNSYKRLAPRLADGTVSWAPVYAAYGDNNRSCLLRLPRNRPAIENRGVDSAANTYITAALMLAAGLEGIENNLDPGEPIEEATYDWDRTRGKNVRLPRTLLEAIDAFDDDPLVHDVFPDQFVRAYVDMKRGEWDDYHRQVGVWEREKYLLAF
ncbi:MAG: glutamine synthetase [Acidimicrobiaceae bacterium]|nr:glutamine synthetase [Acidimicrobiaceae bacterium]